MTEGKSHVIKRVQTFGKKKTAIVVANVRKAAQCQVRINGMPLFQIQPETLRTKMLETIHLVGSDKFAKLRFDITVRGGGPVCQAYAARQAIAKGLVAYYQKYATEVEKMGVKTKYLEFDRSLIADPRRAEAKKWGKHSARSRFTKSYR